MSSTEDKVIESSKLFDMVQNVSKPILDTTEVGVRRGLALFESAFEDITQTKMDQIEASLHEEVIMMSARRVLQLIEKLHAEGNGADADLIHLSLASGLRELGLWTGGLDE
ncbi:MAG: hypothetical protein DRJ03_06905 [Chloroflexi bacterium]|nr:MAG: hypothetical protein DRJ03_06905 [Chloroflexota bacterium]